ncbi:MAG: PIG-L family deacetylase [Oscillospiraceae bacterium]|nr:PIG-L family deacetylase [Oscillospiraceae bacterium]
MNPLLDKLGRAPSLDNIQRALFVQPHPDDNQVAAAGLISKLVAEGKEVYELTVCDDREVDIGYTGEGLTTRQKEVLAAEECLGLKHAGFLGFADKTRASADDISVKIVEVIRKIKPDAVFTADPSLYTECHSDHIKTGEAVKYAVMDAECAFYPSLINGQLRDDAWKVDMIGFYYTDRANTFVDVTEFFEKKIESVKCHVSQQAPGFLFAIGALDQAAAAAFREKYDGPGECEYAEGYRVMSNLHMHCFNHDVLPYKEEEDDDD